MWIAITCHNPYLTFPHSGLNHTYIIPMYFLVFFTKNIKSKLHEEIMLAVRIFSYQVM